MKKKDEKKRYGSPGLGTLISSIPLVIQDDNYLPFISRTPFHFWSFNSFKYSHVKRPVRLVFFFMTKHAGFFKKLFPVTWILSKGCVRHERIMDVRRLITASAISWFQLVYCTGTAPALITPSMTMYRNMLINSI